MTTFFGDILDAITERGRSLVERPGRERRAVATNLFELAEQLYSGRGEASGVATARELLDGYQGLDSAGRTAFFRGLLERFGTDERRARMAAEAFLRQANPTTAQALHHASEPRRQELFRRLNLAPNGTADLVAMRADLLDRLKSHPDFGTVDDDFHHLFQSWFNRGFLVLQRINWHTSAATLEKIIRYEAVHEIGDWNDLRRRIDPADRRLFAFFHPRLLDEPLIFVEVALTTEVPAAIGPILADGRTPTDPHRATTAVFYSISNCQSGLRGVSFGSFLIKQAVEELRRELPGLRTFITLSPVPGLQRWIARTAKDESHPLHLSAAMVRAATDEPGWHLDDTKTTALEPEVMPLAAWYFLHARDETNRPVDAVARFHLGNGARLERINWLADLSARGLSQSFGVMVNYQYRLDDIEKNHEAFVNSGAVQASNAVSRLARALPQPAPSTALTVVADQ